MALFTRKQANTLADAFLDSLAERRRFDYVVEINKDFKGTKVVYFEGQIYESDLEVINSRKGDLRINLTQNPELQAKTRLADYLYQAINRRIEQVKSSQVQNTGIEAVDKIRNSVKYQAYLQNKPIQLDRVIINDKQLTVSSQDSATTYINTYKNDYIKKEELLQLYEEVRQLANQINREDNERKVKISRKNKYKELIEALEPGYTNDYSEYVKQYNQLKGLWEIKLRDGIYQGTSEDEFLKKILYPLNHKMSELFHKDKPMSKYRRIQYDLQNIKDRLTDTQWQQLSIII